MDSTSLETSQNAIDAKTDEENITPWHKLQVNKVFKIVKIKRCYFAQHNKARYIVEMVDETDHKFRIWTDGGLTMRLLQKKYAQIPYGVFLEI